MNIWLRLRCSFGFAFQQDTFAKKYGLGGLFIFLCAPLGWLLALGYRTEVGYRLLDGTLPVLPPWNDWRQFLKNGLRACGVIITYYSPYLISFWLLGLGFAAHGPDAFFQAMITHWPALLCFVCAVVILPPIGVSLMPAAYCYLFPWVSLSPGEMILLMVLFMVPTFLLPAAFMQVLLARSFRAAFRIRNMLAFISGNFLAYIQAWIISGLAAVLGLLLLPFAPWGLFWSYPAITYAFQSIFQPQLLNGD